MLAATVVGVDQGPELFSAEWWRTSGVLIGVMIVGALIITVICSRWARRLRRRMAEADKDREESNRLRRNATITHLLLNTVQIAVWFAVAIVVLLELDVPIGPLIASAGIVGVALGFGAQTIVRDTLSGFFIVLENQYDVGDLVELQTTGGPVNGTIEGLTLRVTEVRAFDGTLHTVPNGNINVTSNRTRGWGRAIVDVKLAFDQDLETVRSLLEDLFGELKGTEPFASGLTSEPKLLGVVQLAETGQVIRITAETLPSKRLEIERSLRSAVTRRLAERGIRLPVTTAPVTAGS